MNRVLRAWIPEIMWHDIGLAPKDGRIIYVSDNDENVDLAKWDNGEWTAELGACSGITKFAEFSLSGSQGFGCDHDWEDIGNGKKQCTYGNCQVIAPT